MDSIKPCPPPNTSKITKTFRKLIHQKKSTKNPQFCLPIIHRDDDKPKCCQFNKRFETESAEEAMEELKNRAFLAKLFAIVSAIKAAYAELQTAQFPYNNDVVQSADQAVVDELKSLSQLKRKFIKKQIDSSPPHVTLMLAEIHEQQSLMKTYEITMKKMRSEMEKKEGLIRSLKQRLNEYVIIKSLDNKMSILDGVRFCDVNQNDFVLVLRYALRSVRNFVKILIREMENASWDVQAASNAIHPHVVFSRSDHKAFAFAFESFVCREIFRGFNDPGHFSSGDKSYDRRVYFFDQFEKLRSSVNAVRFLEENPTSLLGEFVKSKYLRLVHPKMELSFRGDLKQRRAVNEGELRSKTEFFEVFAEMCRRVWLLHCLAFSYEDEVGIFQVKRGCRFNEVYMESVVEDSFDGDGEDFTVAFTVVPGFKFRHMVVQSQVYLMFSTKS